MHTQDRVLVAVTTQRVPWGTCQWLQVSGSMTILLPQAVLGNTGAHPKYPFLDGMVAITTPLASA